VAVITVAIHVTSVFRIKVIFEPAFIRAKARVIATVFAVPLMKFVRYLRLRCWAETAALVQRSVEVAVNRLELSIVEKDKVDICLEIEL